MISAQKLVIVGACASVAIVVYAQGYIKPLKYTQSEIFARGEAAITPAPDTAAGNGSDPYQMDTSSGSETNTSDKMHFSPAKPKQTDTSNKDRIPSTNRDQICSQKERLRHMNKVCDSYKDSVIHTPASEYIVDDKHQLVLGFIHKGGGSTLRMLFVEASGYKIVRNRAILRDNASGPGQSLQDLLRNYLHFGALNETEASRVLSRYFMVMLVRHPFDRLLSAYRCKIASRSSEYSRSLVKDIMVMFNQDIFRKNKTLASMEMPQLDLGPPSFLQFLTWLKETKTPNRHWMSIADTLHPCAVHWSAIMRVETINHDGKLVLDKLRPDVDYDRIPVIHSHQNTTEIADHLSKHLPEYEAIPSDIIEYYLDVYRVDMEMFGYKWNRAKNVATCSIKTEKGQCC